MEYQACPLCGSTYFLSTRRGDGVVFQVNEEQQLLTRRQPNDGGEGDIDTAHIFCGGCSWTGHIDQLVLSLMS